MIDLKAWINSNAKQPLICAISAAICLQAGYLVHLAHDHYSAQIHRIERVVQTASLGVQQANRPLVESALIASLHNSDAVQVALCQGTKADLRYPLSNNDPCQTAPKGIFHWTIRIPAIGVAGHDFVFVVNRLDIFASLMVLVAITALLSLTMVLILIHMRRKFESEVLEPLYHGLDQEKPLEISELDDIRLKIHEHHALNQKRAVSEALFEMSAQVAHDIRSPLAALETVVKDVSSLPENHRIIVRSAVSRIRDIANSLLDRRREASGSQVAQVQSAIAEPVAACLLSGLLDPLVTEKRLQFRSRINVEIDLRMDEFFCGLFAKVQPVEFQRAVSNLINNAVEALKEKGTVTVNLKSSDNEILIEVSDNGEGIPPEILANLGQRGETHGKTGGSGLGLHHARSFAESWGGRLELASQVDKGTTATIVLPQASAPEWFISQLLFEPGQTVVILDDDTSIHQVWQGRLDSLCSAGTIQAIHFSTPQELIKWVGEDRVRAQAALYLLDYELLGYKETGLKLSETLGLGKQTILVTSRYQESGILECCRKLKVRMIPKGLAGLVPIRMRWVTGQDNSDKIDAVLVDDDPLVRATWALTATKAGKQLAVFSSAAEFWGAMARIGRSTPIYLDQELGDIVKGEKLAAQLNGLGFAEIYLATGHKLTLVKTPNYIKGIVGKEPPWVVEEIGATT
ncbi:MAG: HAMP domain-containing histidine kinase [Elusimicrobia bacterium]|nr:HAMP domain-containing histidine kinase [Elusimicrobiota bacterium]